MTLLVKQKKRQTEAETNIAVQQLQLLCTSAGGGLDYGFGSGPDREDPLR